MIQKYFQHFSYFYSYLGYRIFISLGLSLLVGVLDGFGLAMFLPLLEMVADPGGEVQLPEMGRLAFLVQGVRQLGFRLTLQTILSVILVFFTLKGVMKFLEQYYKVVLQQRFMREIRFANIDLLANYQFKSFISADSGRIQNTFTGEVERVLQAYKSYFSTFQFAVMVLVYVGLAFLANPKFAILVMIGGVGTNFIFRRIYKTTKRLSLRLTKENHRFQGLLIQMVANFKYLKATGLVYSFGQKLKQSIHQIEEEQRRIGTLSSVLQAIREPIVIFVITIVILIQVNFFADQLGPLILSLLFFYRSLSFLMGMQNYWNTFLSVSGSMENMTQFTGSLIKEQGVSGEKEFFELQAGIEFRNLCFSIDGAQILKDISFTIERNETVALVGESGAGKTTLMNIICGLLPPDREGMIFVDGQRLEALKLNSYQKKVGYITQEPVVFNDTLFNNITFWDEKDPVNLKRFLRAIAMADLDKFFQNLPKKEETALGNNGIKVSGGQKQRIAIARELYKEVDILLMDEATSALDSGTEQNIQLKLDQLKGKITIVVIAHRLSTVKSADRIFYLSKGELSGQGSLAELTKESVDFRKMVELQNF